MKRAFEKVEAPSESDEEPTSKHAKVGADSPAPAPLAQPTPEPAAAAPTEEKKESIKGIFDSVFKGGGNLFGSASVPLFASAASAGKSEQDGSDADEDDNEAADNDDGIETVTPDVFPGEEQEELLFSNFECRLSKVVKKADASGKLVYCYESLGDCCVRLLCEKAAPAYRLIVRQKNTWKLLVNSPLNAISELSNPKPHLVKFIALDFTKLMSEDMKKSPFTVFLLRFFGPQPATELTAQLKDTIEKDKAAQKGE